MTSAPRPVADKAALRREAIARRAALAPGERTAAAQIIGAREFPLAIAPSTVVAGFSPLKGEIDPMPLMRSLAERGAQLALPVVAGRGRPLVMRSWAFGEPLAAGVWGIREPLPEATAVEPDILIVPLLAFDRAGHRLGYGAGYYDMTINALRDAKPVTAVGIGFAIQEIASVPITSRDARLDLVLTEREIIDCRGT